MMDQRNQGKRAHFSIFKIASPLPRASCAPDVGFYIFRSGHRRFSVRKGVLRNFAKLQENTCARVYFPVNFAKFLKTIFFTEHLRATTSLIILRRTLRS